MDESDQQDYLMTLKHTILQWKIILPLRFVDLVSPSGKLETIKFGRLKILCSY